MRFLFAFVFRLILLVLLTFGFVVLFQHGPAKFPDGVQKEWNAIVVFAGSVLAKPKSAPASATPQPAAPSAASPAPRQSPSPPGANTNKPATAAPTATR